MAAHLLFAFSLSSIIATSLFSMETKQVSPGWDSAQYDKASDGQFQHGKLLLQQVEMDTEAEMTILDVGCGTCRLAAHMAQSFPNARILAIDNDSNMIEKSKEKQIGAPIANLFIENKDARELDYLENVDLVLSVHCLHWFDEDKDETGKLKEQQKDLQKFFAGVERSLKPGGKLLAVFNIDHTEAHPIPTLKCAREITEMPQWAPFYQGKKVLANRIPIELYQKALDESGLEGKASIHHSGTLVLDGQRRMASIYALPLGQAIPVEFRDDFERDVLGKLAEYGAMNPDGTYNQGLDCGMIIATKPMR